MITRSPVVVANTIRLNRSQYQGAFLIVEGRDDRLFFEGFVNEGSCRLVVAEGKDSVREVIRILDSDDDFQGALGMVDSDFDRIEGRSATSPNLIMPERHDLEVMLIHSDAFERLLAEFGSREKIDALERDVLDILVTAALPIGYLRLHSLRAGIGLRFDGLRLSACVDPESFTTDRSSLVQEVKNRSQRQDLSTEDLLDAIRQLEKAGLDPDEVCAGQDLVGILSLGLRSSLGSNKALSVTNEVIRSSLRLAYSEEHFKASSLATSIEVWEAENESFRILR